MFPNAALLRAIADFDSISEALRGGHGVRIAA